MIQSKTIAIADAKDSTLEFDNLEDITPIGDAIYFVTTPLIHLLSFIILAVTWICKMWTKGRLETDKSYPFCRSYTTKIPVMCSK